MNLAWVEQCKRWQRICALTFALVVGLTAYVVVYMVLLPSDWKNGLSGPTIGLLMFAPLATAMYAHMGMQSAIRRSRTIVQLRSEALLSFVLLLIVMSLGITSPRELLTIAVCLFAVLLPLVIPAAVWPYLSRTRLAQRMPAIFLPPP